MVYLLWPVSQCSPFSDTGEKLKHRSKLKLILHIWWVRRALILVIVQTLLATDAQLKRMTINHLVAVLKKMLGW